MGLGALKGIAEGLEKAATNLYNININKQKLQQTQEIFKLEKKQKELEIQKAEYMLSPEQIDMAKKKLDAETKAQTALFNLRSMQMSQAETKSKKELDTYTAGMDMVSKFLAGKIALPRGGAAKVGQFAITGEKGKSSTDLSSLLKEDNSGGNDTKSIDDFLSQF